MAIKKITRALLDTSLTSEIDGKLSASTAESKYRNKEIKITLDDLNAEVRSNILNGQNIVGYDDSILRNRVINCENIVDSFGGVDDYFRKATDKVSESMFDSALAAKINAGVGSNDYLATQIAELQSLKADKTTLVSYRAKIDPIVEADLGLNLANKINAGPTELQTRMTNVETNKADKTYVDSTFRDKATAIDQASLTSGLSSRIDYSFNKCGELEPQVDALIADVDTLKTTVSGSTTGFATAGELNDFKTTVASQYVPLATYSPEISARMEKSANLSDVADVSIARSNLGMLSATYTFTVLANGSGSQTFSFGPAGTDVPVANCIWQLLSKEVAATTYGLPATGVSATESDIYQITVTNTTGTDKDIKLKVMMFSMPA